MYGISNDIEAAAKILENGNLVAIPTETVYGLAANIYDEAAVKKIFDLKQRPLFNPLIVHIHSVSQLSEIAKNIPDKAMQLADAFWPGAITLVLKKQDRIPDIITAGKDSVAVRMPNHPVSLALLRRLDFPLAAPSANPFGCISPTRAVHVQEYFGDTLEMVLDGGDCEDGIESTIIGFEEDEAVLYRLGAIAMEDIEAVIGQVVVRNRNESSPEAPGMLLRHYAPMTKTILVQNVAEAIASYPGKKIGLLLFSTNLNTENSLHQELLSTKGDLKEAASKLYAAMHQLDRLELDLIIAERLPDYGLGKSMNDRLQRATEQ